jgi:hypothetical protein
MSSWAPAFQPLCLEALEDRILFAGAISQLDGGAGLDWFWFSDSSKLADTISHYGGAEVATFTDG